MHFLFSTEIALTRSAHLCLLTLPDEAQDRLRQQPVWATRLLSSTLAVCTLSSE